MLKGKDIITKNYPLDEIRMQTYVKHLQIENVDFKRLIAKLTKKIEDNNKEIKHCESMTLEQWLKLHPKK